MNKEEEELKNIASALIATAFSGHIESIVETIESIIEQIESSSNRHGIQFNDSDEKEIIFSSIIRALEMIKNKKE